jgi:hypothetical protein
MISHLLSTGSDTGRWIRGCGWPTLAAWIVIRAGGLATGRRPCWPASDSLSTAARRRWPPRRHRAWSSWPTPRTIRRAVRAAVRVDRPRARREGEPFSPLALVNEGGEVFAWCCGHRRACLSLAVVCCGDRPAVVRRHLGQWTADMAKPVRADLAPGLPGHGRGDAARLQQVQRPSTPSPLCGSISAGICGWPSLTPALLPATSIGAQCWRPDAGFRIGEADRM